MVLGLLVGQQADLVDAQAVSSVVLPVVGMAADRKLGQQGGGEGAGDSGLAQRRLASEEVRMREATGRELAGQQPPDSRVAGDLSEGIGLRRHDPSRVVGWRDAAWRASVRQDGFYVWNP